MNNKKKKILILTGDAGMGHRSAAEAVSKAIEWKYGDSCETAINNPLNHPDIPGVIRESQSNYDEIVKAIPDLYRLGYEISDAALPVTLMESGFTIVLLDVMRKIIEECSPDLVITTYPIYQAPLDALNESEPFHIPFIAVVTDLVTVHHVWFNTTVSCCTVPTEEVRQLALDAGLSPEQVILTGIPVDPQIQSLKEMSKEALRAELGWQKTPTTLLVVGSPRIPSLIDVIQALDASDEELQLALVSGGNDALYEAFNHTEWQHPTHIYGFIEEMPKVMRAADLIVCKAGGLIVTESLASGLPIMLVHVLPGQERGNVDYVVENGAGELCTTPEAARETLSRWLKHDRKKLAEVAENAEKIGRADAALQIADEAWQCLNNS